MALRNGDDYEIKGDWEVVLIAPEGEINAVD
jgi:hypothetical protein